MYEPGNNQAGETDDQVSAKPGTIRWRWYHFYFLLAIFDLVVIASSLSLYHGTLRSYDRALRGLTALDEMQQWITSVRLAVIELNAPGNDVFETLDVAGERKRFGQTQKQLILLLRREEEYDIDLTAVRKQVQLMIKQENRIFDSFEARTRVESGDEDQETLIEATILMAAMDRHQAKAVAALSGIEKNLQEQESRLLAGYGAQLQRSAAFEKYFFGFVALMLLGTFWYGRKLQRMHERMIENQQRALSERHERLAAVGAVCSSVSHGIRNPLAAITSSAQLALEFGTMDDATQLRIRDALSESRRLDMRINRLLDFARGGREPKQEIDLRTTVGQAVRELSPNVEYRQINLDVTLAEKPLKVLGQAEELTQSVIELLANAIDHSVPGSKVRVTCIRGKREPGCAEINVIDDGPGIPDEIRSQVFDLFFTTKPQGNGIGLASVKRTIESHNGSLTIESTSRGAHLRAVLPIAHRVPIHDQ